MFTFIIPLFIALAITVMATPWVIRFAERIGAVAVPNSRSMHTKPMPCIGGLAIYIGFLAALFISLGFSRLTISIAVGSTLIVTLGLVDDMLELSPRVKFIGQILIACIPVLFGSRIEFVSNPFGSGMFYIGIWGVPLTILWVTAVVNVINFIDGLDGLCAGVSSIASAALFFVAIERGMYPLAVVCIALVGASVGFLKYNFSPAKTFMGDTGAMFLGFVLAVISMEGALKGATTIALTIPIMILGVPIFDTAFAIVRRHRRGQPFYVADKEHLHHRLVAMGFSTKNAVLIIYGISAVLGGAAFVISLLGSITADVLSVLMFGLLVIGAAKCGVIDFNSRSGVYRNRQG